MDVRTLFPLFGALSILLLISLTFLSSFLYYIYAYMHHMEEISQIMEEIWPLYDCPLLSVT